MTKTNAIRSAWEALNSPPREFDQAEIEKTCLDLGGEATMSDLLDAGAIVPFFDGTFITVNRIGWDQ